MSKTLSSFVQVVLLFAICSLAFTMAHAGATTYSDTLFCDYTTGCLGGFTLGFHPPSEPITTYGVGVSGFGFGFSGSSFGPFRQLLFVSASPFDFSASVTNFSEDVQCFDSQNCVYNWGGDFSGGTVTGSIHLLNFDYSTRSLDFTGTINGGWFVANYLYCGQPESCGAYQMTEVDFSGQWSNGWTSTGIMDFSGQINDFSGGPMYLNTQTPEPVSFILFGSGVVGVAGVLRRRLRA